MVMTRDELQFQKIYDEFHARIFRYLTRMVDESEAEDLTQDVFVKIGLSLEGFRSDSQLSTWIYKIATNTAIDWLRRISIRKGTNGLNPESIVDVEEGNACSPGEIIEGEQRVIRQEMNGCIRAVIDSLPEAYRSIIILSELEGLPDAEIAEILNVSLQAAKIRLHRARARLRMELQKACMFYKDEQGELACDRK
jgi:RNA polymerase sigma-70 factor, ECF subfamily